MKIPNLLPKEYQQEYRAYINIQKISHVLFGQVMVLVILSLLLFGYQAWLSQRANSVQADVQVLGQVQDILDAEESLMQIMRFNRQVTAAGNVLQNKQYLSELLRELHVLVPVGVVLDTVEINAGGGEIVVYGRAATRNHLVVFQQRLERSERLTIKNAPLSNLMNSEHAEFSFTLNYRTRDVIKY